MRGDFLKHTDNLEENSFAIIKKINQIENPILRHFIKKFDLEIKDTLLLGVLLESTNQMKTELKTSYEYLGEETGLQKIDIYRGLNTLHRHGVIQYKNDRKNLLQISFNELSDDIEEISLAYRNAEKIRVLRREVDLLNKSDFIPRGELFDSIYPMTGEIIARKISEAFMNLVNYLNEKLERGMDLKRLKYRVKSFITGIPSGELLLLDSLPFVIDEIFMIAKDSGLLLSSVSRSDEEKIDRDMVAGMLTAINEFVRTAFNSDTARDLDEIRYGKQRIVIRSTQYFYIAFVISGAPSFEFLNRTETLGYSLHSMFRNRLKKFSGDTSVFSGAVPLFRDLMSQYNTPPQIEAAPVSYRKLKTAALILLALMLLLLARYSYSCYIDSIHEKEAAKKIKEAVPGNRSETGVEIDGGTVTVRGYASDYQTIKKITEVLSSLGFAENIDNRVLVIDFTLIREYSEKIESLNARINMLESETARKSLETIKIEFPVNETECNNTALSNVDRAASIMKSFPSIKITLAAFSDYEGSVEINRQLAEKRMNSIAGRLQSRGIGRDRIMFIEFDPDYVKNDPRVIASPASRGIVIYASTDQK